MYTVRLCLMCLAGTRCGSAPSTLGVCTACTHLVAALVVPAAQQRGQHLHLGAVRALGHAGHVVGHEGAASLGA